MSVKQFLKPPGSDATLWAVILFGGGIFLLFRIAAIQYPPMLVFVGVTGVVAGIGIWCRQNWARWVSTGLFLAMWLVTPYYALTYGFTIWLWVGFFGLPYSAWTLWKETAVPTPKESPSDKHEDEANPPSAESSADEE